MKVSDPELPYWKWLKLLEATKNPHISRESIVEDFEYDEEFVDFVADHRQMTYPEVLILCKRIREKLPKYPSI